MLTEIENRLAGTANVGAGPAWQPPESAMRRALASVPHWANLEPWAGAGLRHWLGERQYRPPEGA